MKSRCARWITRSSCLPQATIPQLRAITVAQLCSCLGRTTCNTARTALTTVTAVAGGRSASLVAARVNFIVVTAVVVGALCHAHLVLNRQSRSSRKAREGMQAAKPLPALTAREKAEPAALRPKPPVLVPAVSTTPVPAVAAVAARLSAYCPPLVSDWRTRNRGLGWDTVLTVVGAKALVGAVLALGGAAEVDAGLALVGAGSGGDGGKACRHRRRDGEMASVARGQFM